MFRPLITSILFLCAFNIQAQELKTIKLNAPDKTRGTSVMQALNDRKSVREYAPESLNPQDLSDLLWAANGINRPDGRRTAPSARNLQSVELYVIFPEGAYFYDHKEHALNPIVAGDFRSALTGGQEFAKTAPLAIVMVADMSKYGNMSENSMMMAAVDVGIVCQNINIACAAFGLVTVPRGIMDKVALKDILKLTDNHILLINNPVGYPKK